MVGLDEGLPDGGGDHGVLALGDMGQRIAHRMNPAPLPCCAEGAGDGSLQPFVSIRDDQLDASEAPAHQIAQEACPERLGFGGTYVQADDLPFPVRVDGYRYYRCDRNNATALTHLQVGSVQP